MRYVTHHDLGAALCVAGLACVEAGVPLVHGGDGEAVVRPHLPPGHLVTAVIPIIIIIIIIIIITIMIPGDIRGRHTLGHRAVEQQGGPSQHQVTRPAQREALLHIFIV